jgi:hypothetical protein
MNFCCFFIKDKALFGSFPIQSSVDELEENGVRYFINLTHDTEKKIVPYKTKYFYMNYPINDHSIPDDLYSFSNFIIKLSKIIRELKDNEKIYIHCRGGRTRSATVASVLLCHMFLLSPYESLQYTTKCYMDRRELKEKWRKLGSPQTYVQKKFIYKSFHPVNMNMILKSILNTKIESEIGCFSNIQECLKVYKENFISNKENPIFYKYQNRKNEIDKYNWNVIQDNIIKMLIYKVIETNTEIKELFMRTFLRPINISYIEQHLFWKNQNIDTNKFAKLLTNVRTRLFL